MAGDHHHRSIDGEEPEAALFLTYPCTALYYVQSPSTHSHDNESAAFVSPYRAENFMISNTTTTNQDVNRFMLSRYSSSRESNTTSFLHEKKIVYDIQCHDDNDIGVEEIDEDDLRRRICKVEELRKVEEEEDDDYDGRRKGCWRYFSFSTSSSCIWISIQIFWRLMVSLGIALFVFFLATKPPSPKMSIKIAGIREFGLTEGVDSSGITTKILSCNCSMALQVDNKSKLFGLHIHSSAIQISFGTFIFANSQTPKLYADNDRSTTFELFAGTKNKAMYGAGRSMQDMLESGKGLPLFVSMNLRSNFHVVRKFIKTKFKHRVECLLVLRGAYDKKHRTQAYNSSCRISSTS